MWWEVLTVSFCHRWMAPEVIEHNPYREKADVFSFGITMWELLTARVPYEQMTPLQAAVGVVAEGPAAHHPARLPGGPRRPPARLLAEGPPGAPPLRGAQGAPLILPTVPQEARPAIGPSQGRPSLQPMRTVSFPMGGRCSLCSWVCEAQCQ